MRVVNPISARAGPTPAATIVAGVRFAVRRRFLAELRRGERPVGGAMGPPNGRWPSWRAAREDERPVGGHMHPRDGRWSAPGQASGRGRSCPAPGAVPGGVCPAGPRAMPIPCMTPPMPFHVEVKRSIHRARLFNVGEAELRRIVVPWARGEPVEVGDREWVPAESTLKVLEGRALEPAELAHGQGWHSAERVAEDVTEQVLRPAVRSVAVLAATPAVAASLAAMLRSLGIEPVDWSPDAAAPAVIALGGAEDELTAATAFEMGRAAGAAGPDAVFVQVGAGPLPPMFEPLD